VRGSKRCMQVPASVRSGQQPAKRCFILLILLQLVRAYLQLMQMRMPDRLQFSVQADPAVARLRCPPTAPLTLVESAVRHGINPKEEGGRIDVSAVVADGRCRLRVRDTGVGLQPSGSGLGTGLAALQERLELMYGDDAHLRLAERRPHGVEAELEFPAESIV
jgi:LytS/YehU family sensor histidine kinase